MGKHRKTVTASQLSILVLIYSSFLISTGFALHPSFCSPFGSGIGMHHFPADMLDKFSNNWPTCNPKDPGCITDAPTIRIYSISTSKGILNGWLRVNIQFSRRDLPIIAYYIVGEMDEHSELNSTYSAGGSLNQGKGEFVADFPQSSTCPSSGITKYQLFPCGGIGRSEVAVPVGAFYIHPAFGNWYAGTDQKTSLGIVQALGENVEEGTEFNLYFRFSDYYCTIRRFYFRSYVVDHQLSLLPSHDFKLRVTPSMTPYITPRKLTGASDPKPKAGEPGLDCSHEITEATKDAFDWVQELKFDHLEFGKKPSCWGNEDSIESEVVRKYRFGSHSTDVLSSLSTVYKSARCASGDQIQTTDRLPKVQNHYCEIVSRSMFTKILDKMNTWEIYEEYLSKLSAINQGKCACEEKATTDMDRDFEELDGGQLVAHSNGSNTTSFLTRGIRADKRNGKILWRARVGHGIMMVIMGMFIIPVNHFITRYYKETFMGVRILFFRVWTVVHIQSIPSTWIFIIAGLVCSGIGETILGNSFDPVAIAHRRLGWVMIVLYMFLTVFGGVRCFQDTKRRICIGSHWFLGNLFYITNLILILLSVVIPGSPIADEDETFEEDKFNAAYFIVPIWIVLDVAMHSIMTAHTCVSDREMDLSGNRYYFPVPIPLVRENDLDDAPHSTFRKFMLPVYIAISLAFTSGLCWKMGKMPNENRGFGPMTCTHYNISTARERLKESCNFASILAHLNAIQSNQSS